MLSKKTIKKIIKITIWGYIIVTACPQIVNLLCGTGATLVSEGFKWCGIKIGEGIVESIQEGIPDFPGKEFAGKLWEKGWEIPNSDNPLKNFFKGIMDSGMVRDRPIDEEDVRIITDIVEKGGTVISRLR